MERNERIGHHIGRSILDGEGDVLEEKVAGEDVECGERGRQDEDQEVGVWLERNLAAHQSHVIGAGGMRIVIGEFVMVFETKRVSHRFRHVPWTKQRFDLLTNFRRDFHVATVEHSLIR